jgi:hypothetical protein
MLLERLLFAGRRIKLSDAAEVKRQLGETFEALSLDERRRLVKATVDVVVYPGGG